MTNKDLIKQYINTGLNISEYQFNQLSNSQKKSYIRARWNTVKNNITSEEFDLEPYEFFILPEEIKKYICKKFKVSSKKIFFWLFGEDEQHYIDNYEIPEKDIE